MSNNFEKDYFIIKIISFSFVTSIFELFVICCPLFARTLLYYNSFSTIEKKLIEYGAVTDIEWWEDDKQAILKQYANYNVKMNQG